MPVASPETLDCSKGNVGYFGLSNSGSWCAGRISLAAAGDALKQVESLRKRLAGHSPSEAVRRQRSLEWQQGRPVAHRRTRRDRSGRRARRRAKPAPGRPLSRRMAEHACHHRGARPWRKRASHGSRPRPPRASSVQLRSVSSPTRASASLAATARDEARSVSSWSTNPIS